MKIFNFLLVLVLFTNVSNAQIKDTIQEQHVVFFKTMSANGGTWVAENPKYDSSKQNDFSQFIMKTKLKDALQIEAEILGVNTKQDTIKFWTFNEFYAPDKKKNIFYQRSKDGMYYASGEATMIETERYCEMIFYYSGGEYLKHKDTHIFTNENEMRSVSYDFDPKTKAWINESILIWKRKH